MNHHGQLKPWFRMLPSAQAARVLVGLESLRLGGWLDIVGEHGSQFVFEWGGMKIPLGRPGDTLIEAVRRFTRSMSRLTASRWKRDEVFRHVVLATAGQLFVDGDDVMCRAVLRRVLSVTAGYQQVAVWADVNPKSVVRMLGPQGNPSAAVMSRLIAALARTHGVTLDVRHEAAKPR